MRAGNKGVVTKLIGEAETILVGTHPLEEKTRNRLTRIEKALKEKAAKDPGAPFEMQAIRALHTLKKADPAEYERARVDLKGLNVGLSRLGLDALVGCDFAAEQLQASLERFETGNHLVHPVEPGTRGAGDRRRVEPGSAPDDPATEAGEKDQRDDGDERETTRRAVSR